MAAPPSMSPEKQAELFTKMLDLVAPQLQGGETKLSSEELSRFRSAFGTEEGQRLLKEVLDEQQDPKNRAETEAWLQQEERKGALPEGRMLVRPEPGFAIATTFKAGHAKAGQRLIINVVRYDGLSKPDVNGASVRMGVCSGPTRREVGQGVGPLVGLAADAPVLAVDVCVHSDAINRALSSASSATQWVKIVSDFAIDSAEGRLAADAARAGAGGGLSVTQLAGNVDLPTVVADKKKVLEEAWVKLRTPYVSADGLIPSMMVPKEEGKEGTAAPLPAPGSAKKLATLAAGSPASPAPAKAAASPAKGAAAPPAAASPAAPPAAAAPASPARILKGPDGVFLRAPRTSVVHRNAFEMHTQSGSSSSPSSSRPRELKLDFAMPGIVRAAELDTALEEREMRVTSVTVFKEELPGGEGTGSSPLPFRYYTVVPLPFPVSTADADLSAKWDKGKATLTVVLKVLPAPPVTATAKPSPLVQEMPEVVPAEEAAARAPTPSTSSSKPMPPEQLPAAHSSWIKQRVEATGVELPPVAASPAPAASSPSIVAPTPAAAPASAPASDSNLRAGGEPPFSWRQAGPAVSVLLLVPRATTGSVSLEWGGVEGSGAGQTANDVTVTFTSSASPQEVFDAASAASKAMSAGAAADGTKWVYSVELRLAGRVLTGGATRADVAASNVALVLSKAAPAEKWADLVRAPPLDVEEGGEKAAAAAQPAAPVAAPSPAKSAAAAPSTPRETDRVTAGTHTPTPAPAEEEEEEIFELGRDGTFDTTKSKKKASAVKAKASTAPSPSAVRSPVPAAAPVAAPSPAPAATPAAASPAVKTPAVKMPASARSTLFSLD